MVYFLELGIIQCIQDFGGTIKTLIFNVIGIEKKLTQGMMGNGENVLEQKMI